MDVLHKTVHKLNCSVSGPAKRTASADLKREQAELERVRELRERHSVFAPFAGIASKGVKVN